MKAFVRGVIYTLRVLVFICVGMPMITLMFGFLLVYGAFSLVVRAPPVWYYQMEDWAFEKEGTPATLDKRRRFYEDIHTFWPFVGVTMGELWVAFSRHIAGKPLEKS